VTRRRFLQGGLAFAGVGLLAGCGVTPPWSREPAKIPRVGYLGSSTRDLDGAADVIARTLNRLGYVDGETISFEWRFPEAEAQIPALAAELAALGVDVIVSTGNLAAQAAKRASTTIPIVLVNHTDPVGTGLVASLARPGGNITGTTNYNPRLAAKRVQLFTELLPGAARFAYLVNPNNSTFAVQEGELQEGATALGVELLRLEVRAASELEAAVASAGDGRADGLIVLADSLVLAPQRAKIADLTLRHRLPALAGERRSAEAGGLISYGVNAAERFEASAVYVDRILKGAKPAELPIEGPTQFEFVINSRTAQSLGLTIPQAVLQQATEVIQ
jgi:putative ABC transport system substrate-binding protein